MSVLFISTPFSQTKQAELPHRASSLCYDCHSSASHPPKMVLPVMICYFEKNLISSYHEDFVCQAPKSDMEIEASKCDLSNNSSFTVETKHPTHRPQPHEPPD
jgi:hypothetical protein